MRSGLTILMLVAALGALALAPGSAPGRDVPRILDVQYYEDLEDGYRYNVVATVKGAETVDINMGGHRAKGRLSGQIGPATGGGKDWFFRHRPFVRAVRQKLQRDGTATVFVSAAASGSSIGKRCTLILEPDPVYGDFAGGDCNLVVVGTP